MFTACAIEFEGLSGDNANPEGDDVHIGSWFLIGDGYVISSKNLQEDTEWRQKSRKYPEPTLGMNSYHAIGL